ncbi:MAG: LysM peptidoglycan-binding domain-containing protein [Deltaproteobacteria bacterium]|nr:LysM peptidoglycan-binding domain-containing protein [Deltaproteobacteria bacterium]
MRVESGGSRAVQKQDDEQKQEPKATAKAGETLADVARDNGTTEEKLRELNPQVAEDGSLKAGQELRLPPKEDADRAEDAAAVQRTAPQGPAAEAAARLATTGYEDSAEAPAPQTDRPSAEQALLPEADPRAQEQLDDVRHRLQMGDVTGAQQAPVGVRVEHARGQLEKASLAATDVRGELQQATTLARAAARDGAPAGWARELGQATVQAGRLMGEARAAQGELRRLTREVEQGVGKGELHAAMSEVAGSATTLADGAGQLKKQLAVLHREAKSDGAWAGSGVQDVVKNAARCINRLTDAAGNVAKVLGGSLSSLNAASSRIAERARAEPAGAGAAPPSANEPVAAAAPNGAAAEVHAAVGLREAARPSVAREQVATSRKGSKPTAGEASLVAETAKAVAHKQAVNAPENPEAVGLFKKLSSEVVKKAAVESLASVASGIAARMPGDLLGKANGGELTRKVGQLVRKMDGAVLAGHVVAAAHAVAPGTLGATKGPESLRNLALDLARKVPGEKLMDVAREAAGRVAAQAARDLPPELLAKTKGGEAIAHWMKGETAKLKEELLRKNFAEKTAALDAEAGQSVEEAIARAQAHLAEQPAQEPRAHGGRRGGGARGRAARGEHAPAAQPEGAVHAQARAPARRGTAAPAPQAADAQQPADAAPPAPPPPTTEPTAAKEAPPQEGAAAAPAETRPPVDIPRDDTTVNAGNMWHDQAINMVHDAAAKEGSLEDKQVNANGKTAREALGIKEDNKDEPAKALTQDDVAQVAKDAGVDVSKLDPAHLQEATAYVNDAKDAGEQAEKLRKTLNTFNVLENKGIPEFTAAETKTIVDSKPVRQGPPLTEEDAQKIGTGLGENPPQALWNEQAVNTFNTRGQEQGGITQAQVNQNGAYAAKVMNPDGKADPKGPPKEITAGDVAGMVRDAGVPLEKQDPNQLQAATNYINGATTLEEQQERVRKTLNNFQVLDKIGAPKLSDQEAKDLLWGAAKIPGHAGSTGSANGDLQKVAAAVNSPGSHEFKIGKHNVKMTVNDQNTVTGSSTKKPSFLSKVGSFIKKAAPIVLKVASFIPGPVGVAARVVSGVINVVKAVKAGSILGAVSGIASTVAGGITGALGKGFDAASKGLKTVVNVCNGVAQAARGIQSIKQGGIAGIVGGVAGVVGGVAQGLGNAASGASKAMESVGKKLGEVSKHLQNASQGIGAVQNIQAANKAVNDAKAALAQARASGDATAVRDAEKRLADAESSKRSSLLGAASTAASLGASYASGPKQDGTGGGLKHGLNVASGALNTARAVNEKDYLGAAASGLFTASTIKDGKDGPAVEQNRDKDGNLVDAQGNVVTDPAKAGTHQVFDGLRAAANLGQAADSVLKSGQAEKAAEQAVRDAESSLAQARASGDSRAVADAEQQLRKAREGAVGARQASWDARSAGAAALQGTLDSRKATRDTAAGKAELARAEAARAAAEADVMQLPVSNRNFSDLVQAVPGGGLPDGHGADGQGADGEGAPGGDPSAGTAETPPPVATKDVKLPPGGSLEKLARDNNVTVAELRAANPELAKYKDTEIPAGINLKVPLQTQDAAGRDALKNYYAATQAGATADVKGGNYTVKAGDNLTTLSQDVAKRLGISEADAKATLMMYNPQLAASDGKLYRDNKLFIPEGAAGNAAQVLKDAQGLPLGSAQYNQKVREAQTKIGDELKRTTDALRNDQLSPQVRAALLAEKAQLEHARAQATAMDPILSTQVAQHAREGNAPDAVRNDILSREAAAQSALKDAAAKADADVRALADLYKKTADDPSATQAQRDWAKRSLEGINAGIQAGDKQRTDALNKDLAQLAQRYGGTMNRGGLGDGMADFIGINVSGMKADARGEFQTLQDTYKQYQSKGFLTEKERQIIDQKVDNLHRRLGDVDTHRKAATDWVKDTGTSLAVGAVGVATGGAGFAVAAGAGALAGVTVRTGTGALADGRDYQVRDFAQDALKGTAEGVTGAVGAGKGGAIFARAAENAGVKVIGGTAGKVSGGVVGGLADAAVGNASGAAAGKAVELDNWSQGFGQGLRNMQDAATSSVTTREGLAGVVVGGAVGGLGGLKGTAVDVNLTGGGRTAGAPRVTPADVGTPLPVHPPGALAAPNNAPRTAANPHGVPMDAPHVADPAVRPAAQGQPPEAPGARLEADAYTPLQQQKRNQLFRDAAASGRSVPAEAQARLEQGGVAVAPDLVLSADGGIRERIIIKPEGNHPLNRFARSLNEKFGNGRVATDTPLKVVYDPELSPHANASYDPATNTLAVSHEAVVDLHPGNNSSAHEVVHAAKAAAVRRGTPRPDFGRTTFDHTADPSVFGNPHDARGLDLSPEGAQAAARRAEAFQKGHDSGAAPQGEYAGGNSHDEVTTHAQDMRNQLLTARAEALRGGQPAKVYDGLRMAQAKAARAEVLGAQLSHNAGHALAHGNIDAAVQAPLRRGDQSVVRVEVPADGIRPAFTMDMPVPVGRTPAELAVHVREQLAQNAAHGEAMRQQARSVTEALRGLDPRKLTLRETAARLDAAAKNTILLSDSQRLAGIDARIRELEPRARTDPAAAKELASQRVMRETALRNAVGVQVGGAQGRALVTHTASAAGATDIPGFVASTRAEFGRAVDALDARPAPGADAELVTPQLDAPGGRTRQQIEAGLDAAYTRAAEAHPRLKADLEGLAARTGGQASVPGLKGRPRALEKVLADYGGDPTRLKDLARGMVVYDSPEAFARGLEDLRRTYPDAVIKDRFTTPTAEGYRDVIAHVPMQGTTVEVQLQHRDVLAVKEGPGHRIYEQIRSLEARARQDGRALTGPEQAYVDGLRQRSRALYDVALHGRALEPAARAYLDQRVPLGELARARLDDATAASPQLRAHPEEARAIHAYTMSGFKELNRALRSTDPAAIREHLPYVAALNRGLSRLPAYQGRVLRGLQLDNPAALVAQYRAHMAEGVPVVHHDFLSTTSAASAPTTLGRRNVVYDIQSRTGRDISALSYFGRAESEVLFAHGTAFRVEAVDVRPDGSVHIRMTEAE